MSGWLFTAISLVLTISPAAQVVATAELIRQLSQEAGLDGVAVPVAIVIVILGVTGPLRTVQSALGERIALSSGARMLTELAGVASRLPPSVIARNSVSAEIEGHTRAIIDAVAQVYVTFIQGLQSAVSALLVIGTLATLSPLGAVFVVLSVVPSMFAARYVSQVSSVMWGRIGNIYQRERYFRELLGRRGSLLEMSSLGSTQVVGDLLSKQQDAVVECRDMPIRARLLSSVIVGGVSTVLLALALFAVLFGTGFGPVAVAGVFAVISATSASAEASNSFASLIQFQPQASQLRQFVVKSAGVGIQDVQGRVDRLAVRGLVHSYGPDQHPVLHDVSFSVSRGEIVALVGENGAGKTTTVSCITGATHALEGEVFADEVSLGEVGEAAWLGRFGVLSQEFGRYELTVRDAVRMGCPEGKASDDAIRVALERAHADTFVNALPDGLDTMLGTQWGGVGLSGGQWQRIALSRIHLRDAPVWILDEPTSAIDAETEAEVFAELIATKRDRITIVVSHRAWTLRGMDRIYVLQDGQIAEHGTYEELMARGGRFVEMFAEQRLD